MNKINFRKVTSLPPTPDLNSLYILKDPVDKKITLHIGDNTATNFYSLEPIPGSTTVNAAINIDTNQAVTGATCIIKITNYDAGIVYNIVSTTATIVLTKDSFTYKTTQAAGYVDNMTINGIVKPITIINPSVDKPTLTLNTTSSTGEPSHGLLKSSPVKDSYGNPLLSCDWEISTLPDFSTIYASSYLDTVNLNSFITPFLKPASTYYARLRHKTAIGYSAWSDSVTIVTSITCDIKYQQQKIYPIERGISNNSPVFNYGFSQAITPDGTRMVVGAPNTDRGETDIQVGVVHVYKRNTTDDVWVLEKTLLPDTYIQANMHFGWSVAITPAGDTIVVGAPDGSMGATGSGLAFVYKRKGNIWYIYDYLFPLSADRRAADAFGYSVCVSDNGSVVAVGVVKGVGSVAGGTPGYVCVFVDSGTVYQIATNIRLSVLLSLTLSNTARFGQSIAISGDGKIIAVGASGADAITGTYLNTGAVLVFTYSSMVVGNVVLASTQKIIRSTAEMVTGDAANFGFSVIMTSKADQIIVGCPNRTVGAFTNAGCCYYSTKGSSGTWGITQKIQPSVSEANANYGISLAGTIDFGKIAVGCYLKDFGGRIDCGAAYVYTKSNTLNQFANASVPAVAGPSEQILYAEDYIANDQFGRCVSLSSYPLTANIGAISGFGVLGLNNGCVYTFRHI